MPPRLKYIYDPIHGSIPLQGAVLELVGHPLVQRLWGIRQMGMAHLVFPGASHTRLEHSLGVLWVARQMADRLGLDAEDALGVEVAGLLHDLGHTPFSHSLESSLVEVTGMTHEGRTRRMIVEGTHTDMERYGSDIPDYQKESIPELLNRQGIVPRSIADLLRNGRGGVAYLSEMLHGTIDADRLDYLERDAHYTGVAHGIIDTSRLLETVKVDRGHISFAEKGTTAVKGFLLARGHMYTSVYYNKTVRIAEAMVQSALERFPGYPEAGRKLLAMTDWELLAALDAAEGRPREMSRRLTSRALFKSAFTVSEHDDARGCRWKYLVRHPEERRAIEDDISERFHGRPGDVIIDLPNPLELPGDDVRMVTEEGKIRLLLKNDPPLAHLVSRSPMGWRLAVYTTPKMREMVKRQGRKLLDRCM